MSVPLEKFLPYISSVAEGVPNFVVEKQLLATAADMCQQTGCISTEINLVGKAGVSTYALPVTHGLEVETIRYVYVDGKGLAPTRMDELLYAYHGDDWEKETGTPLGFLSKKPNTVTLVPAPSEDCSIKVVAYASVPRDANVLPDEFFDDYLDVLVEGTLARIYRIAGQVYTNTQLAAACAMRYSLLLTDVKSAASRDFSKSCGRVVFNRII